MKLNKTNNNLGLAAWRSELRLNKSLPAWLVEFQEPDHLEAEDYLFLTFLSGKNK